MGYGARTRHNMRYLLLIMLFAGCTSAPTFSNIARPGKLDWGMRAGASVVTGKHSATLQVQKSRDRFETISDSTSGSGFRGRAELFRRFGQKEFGVHFAMGEMDYADTTTSDVGLTYRNFFQKKDLRPYTEVRVGLRSQEQAGILGGSPDVRGSGRGLAAGFGVGVEKTISDQFGLFLQLDVDYSTMDIGNDFNGRTLEWGAMVGGTVRF